jgi:hypothetical protein
MILNLKTIKIINNNQLNLNKKIHEKKKPKNATE